MRVTSTTAFNLSPTTTGNSIQHNILFEEHTAIIRNKLDVSKFSPNIIIIFLNNSYSLRVLKTHEMVDFL